MSLIGETPEIGIFERQMSHTTQQSLLIRVKDHDDAEAWGQFVDIYGPLIHRFGKRKGLQEADAADLMQDVLQRVSKSIVKFDYNPDLGRFRSWLFLISSQALSALIKKHARQPLGAGDSVVTQMLHQAPSREDESSWDDEYRQRILSWAIDQIRGQVAEKTWQAFHETGLKNRPAQLVANELGISVGAVYVAKSRVTKRLKEQVASIDDSLE